jgi:hypothetical protein
VPARFWRSLLRRRAVTTWGNFSWISTRTLLLSANDQIAKLIEGPYGRASIVDVRRMRWVAAQRARGVNMDQAVQLPATNGMILLGDPGEIDASQYVLAAELAARQAHWKAEGVDTLLMMSDIVYPAGDVNAWADAVYLPYMGLPPEAWKAARDEVVEHVPEAARQLPAKPGTWRLFASPGNHDWYDGLNGFMFHACGAEALGEVSYSTAGRTLRQRLARKLWLKPGRPDRARLMLLKEQLAKRADDAGHHEGSIPRQPGPYYSIELGCRRAQEGQCSCDEHVPLVRVVVVDTGITGAIDAEQARWVTRRLEGDLPKIVITGKPLAVDEEIGAFPIAERRPDHDRKRAWDRPTARDLREVIAEGENVVASVAGDIHNYQRLVLVPRDKSESGTGKRGGVYRLPACEDTGAAGASGTSGEAAGDAEEGRTALPEITVSVALDPAPPPRGVAPVQIVAGGGGAYMSSTHATAFGSHGKLTLRPPARRRKDEAPAGEGQCPTALPIDAEAHTRFPLREESVLLFSDRVVPTAMAIATLAIVALTGLIVLGLDVSDAMGRMHLGGWKPSDTTVLRPSELPRGQFLIAPYAVLGGVGFMVAGVASLFGPLPHLRKAASKVGVGAALFVSGFWVALADLPLLLLGIGVIVALVLAVWIVPLVRAFPMLLKVIPLRRVGPLLTVALVTVAVGHADDNVGVVLLVVVGAAALLMGLRGAFQKALEADAEASISDGRPPRGAGIVAVLPTVLTLVALSQALWWLPRILIGDGSPDDRHAVADIRFLGLTVGALVLTSLIVTQLLVPFWKIRRHAPARLYWIAAVAAVGALIGTVLALQRSRETEAVMAAALGLLAALCALTLTLAVTTWWANRIRKKTGGSGTSAGLALNSGRLEAVRCALEQRDTDASERETTIELFRHMWIANWRSVAEIAEATQPPFAKSFVKLTVEPAAAGTVLTFTAYGLHDEKLPVDPAGPLAARSAKRGLFEIDRVVVRHNAD